MVRIVVAPDGFKGSITAAGAARAIRDGWLRRRPSDDVVTTPMADGGEGTLDAIAAALPSATRVRRTVSGPAGGPVAAEWLRIPRSVGTGSDTALVELASASGIEHFPSTDDLLPLDAHTVGLGELVADAVRSGVGAVVVTLGSSASTDGGTGLLRAMGARFTDGDGNDVATGARGLAAIRSVDTSGLLALPSGGITAIVDVDNPLTGPTGAAAVFGPQKGLRGADADAVDAALDALAHLLGVDPATPGLGAAGGTPLALTLVGARSRSGADAVAEIVGLDGIVEGADLVVTGEGRYDDQSERGKTPSSVRDLARRHGVPTAIVAGGLGRDPLATGFVDAVSLTELAGSAHAARADPEHWLVEAGAVLADRFTAR